MVSNLGQMQIENIKHLKKIEMSKNDAVGSLGGHNFKEMNKIANTGKVSDSVITNFKSNEKGGAEISFVNFSENPASIFFEKGVIPHKVFASYNSVNGYLVRQWLDSKGLTNVNSFTVGGANSAMRKPGVMFMEKSFDLTWKLSDAFFSKKLLKAIL